MDYTFFRMNIGGDSGRSTKVVHDCDEDALAQAQMFTVGRAVEVWCGERHLATLLPTTVADISRSASSTMEQAEQAAG